MSRPSRRRGFGRTADRGSDIDEQRAGTVHSTQTTIISMRAAGGCPILRLRFLMRWVLPPILRKNAVAGAASATNASSRRGLYIVQSAEAPKCGCLLKKCPASSSVLHTASYGFCKISRVCAIRAEWLVVVRHFDRFAASTTNPHCAATALTPKSQSTEHS